MGADWRIRMNIIEESLRMEIKIRDEGDVL